LVFDKQELAMRINARLDEETQAQLEYITLTTGSSTSHVVRESVAQYYLHVRSQQRPRMRFLDLVGHSGRTDVASNFKTHVAQIMEEKLARSHPPTGTKTRVKAGRQGVTKRSK
jgi:hypothetical protein